MKIEKNILINELLVFECWLYIDSDSIVIKKAPFKALKWLVNNNIVFKINENEEVFILDSDLQ